MQNSPSSTLYVYGIPKNVTDQAISDFFDPIPGFLRLTTVVCSEEKYITEIYAYSNCVYAYFDSIENASMARNYIDGNSINQSSTKMYILLKN